MGVDMYAVGVRSGVLARPYPEWRDEWSYHLNWRGMSRMCEEMETVGVLDLDTPEPAWPEWIGEEHLQERADPDDLGDDWEPLDAIGEAWCEASRIARYQLGEHGKVPQYKFGSNDGWIVTPVECIWIADALDERVALLDEPWQGHVEDFIAFNRRCSEGANGYKIR